MMRFKCSRQRMISGNKISKRWFSRGNIPKYCAA
jgi:hypothetical protein